MSFNYYRNLLKYPHPAISINDWREQIDLIAKTLEVDCCALYQVTARDTNLIHSTNKVNPANNHAEKIRLTAMENKPFTDNEMVMVLPITIGDELIFGGIIIIDKNIKELSDIKRDILKTFTKLFIKDIKILKEHDKNRYLSSNEKLLKELNIAKHEAEMANKSKTDFLNHMSHELRTPLNAIIGFSELVAYEIFGPVENDKYKSYIESIHDSGEYLLDLINDILQISKIEANEHTINPENFAVSALLDECINLVEPKIGTKIVTFNNLVEDANLSTYCDKRHLKQVIINILTNALKYTINDDIVSITAKNENGSIIIRIKDNGPGIEKSELENVFVPFKQADEEAHITKDGVGLGLPLSRSLMHINGGDLTLESDYGFGTTAVIKTLPQKITHNHPDVAPISKGSDKISESAASAR